MCNVIFLHERFTMCKTVLLFLLGSFFFFFSVTDQVCVLCHSFHELCGIFSMNLNG